MLYYISHSAVEKEERGNQLQVKLSFEYVSKKIPVVGIFLSGKKKIYTKIQHASNKYVIDYNTCFDWIEKILGIISFKKNITPSLFAFKSSKIIKKDTQEKDVYLRIFSLIDGIFFIKRMNKFKIRKLACEFHDIDYKLPIYKKNIDRIFRKYIFKSFIKHAVNAGEKVTLVTVSHTLAEQFSKEFSYPYKIAVIPNGHNFEHLEPKNKYSFGNDHIKIIYTGLNLYKMKGLNHLIEALDFLDHRFLVHIIGGTDAHRNELNQKYKKFVAQKRLIIDPPKNHQEMIGYMQKADLAVIPLPKNDFSLFTSPLKLFEYMAAGLPIVASDVATIKEVINDRQDGLLYEAGDVHSMVQMIKILVSHKSLAETIGKGAYRTSKNYTYEKRAERILEIFN